MEAQMADVGAAPQRSLAQRMEALKRANDIRSRRARFKHQMKVTGRGEKGEDEARKRAADVATAVPGWAETMKVLDLLMSIPKVGRVKANRLMNQCQISHSKTVGGMSERQRRELTGEIGKL